MSSEISEYFDKQIEYYRNEKQEVLNRLEIIESKIRLLEATQRDIEKINKPDFMKHTTNPQTGVQICKSNCESYIKGKCKTNGMAKVTVGDDCLWGR